MLGFTGSRTWIYPMAVAGRFQTVRRWTFFALHLILFIPPWISIGGHPSIRVDLPGRQLFLLGEVFTASDTIFLLLILLFLAFSLFFFTSLFGRLWCGFGCPQTVFLENWIRPLEQWIEGSQTIRRRRDEAGFSFDLLWRKLVKWSAFMAVAVLLSMAFMSFFAGARELWTGGASRSEYTLVAIFAFFWYWDFAWFREQFCNYLCPYARFQSAMTDRHTLMVTYVPERGEPRGGKAARVEGRCIACNKCVAVCPQGIDIRNGFQLECISCARCIDACEDVMGRIGHPTLVQWGSMAQLAAEPGRRVRPRTMVYASLLGTIVAAGVFLGASRVPFEATVNRAPGSLFTVDPDGFVRNTYLVSVRNNDANDRVTFTFEIRGLGNAEVLSQPVELASTERRTVPLVVRIPGHDALDRTIPIEVLIQTSRGNLVLRTTFKTGADLGTSTSRS